MTASQPATPGSDGEVCTCGHRLAHHVSVGGCCIGACLCPATRPAALSEPPAADSPTPGTVDPATGHAWNGLRWIAQDQSAAPSPVGTTEPPAETQQDDATPVELLLLHLDLMEALHGGDPKVAALIARKRAALAARPSADTETLDRMRAAVERAIPADVVPRINFDWLMRDLRAALDGERP